jgi:hypothetical protein
MSVRGVLLSWNASTGATYYDVSRNGVLLAGHIATTSYLDTTVVIGSTYTYDVDAGNANGTSPASASVKLTVAGGVKPCLRGLGPRGTATPSVSWQLFGVLDIDWSALQPSAGAALSASGVGQVNAAQAFWQTFNKNNPQYAQYGGGGFKIRTGRAGGAPADVKAMSGGPWSVTDPADNDSVTVGPFWQTTGSGSYGAAYQDFHTKLAALVEPMPECREIVMGMPGLVYEEPMRRYSLSTLVAAGWDVTNDEDCFAFMLGVHNAAYATTLQDMAFNPYTWTGSPADDPGFTVAFMHTMRNALGDKGVLGNNSVRDTTTDSSMYAEIETLGEPIYFQTATAARGGDTAAAYAFCIARGANSVEIAAGAVNATQAVQTALLANAA